MLEIWMCDPNPTLSKERILAALDALHSRLEQKGVIGELCVFGGATMVLAFDARPSTRDVDAVFVPKSEISEAAALVAGQLALPATWLNDGVKGFVSPSGELTECGQILDVVANYYPVHLIPAKTAFFIEEVVEQLKGGTP